jgi:hypothetical protein
MDTLWPFKAAVKEQWQHINLPLNFQPFFIMKIGHGFD